MLNQPIMLSMLLIYSAKIGPVYAIYIICILQNGINVKSSTFCAFIDLKTFESPIITVNHTFAALKLQQTPALLKEQKPAHESSAPLYD